MAQGIIIMEKSKSCRRVCHGDEIRNRVGVYRAEFNSSYLTGEGKVSANLRRERGRSCKIHQSRGPLRGVGYTGEEHKRKHYTRPGRKGLLN